MARPDLRSLLPLFLGLCIALLVANPALATPTPSTRSLSSVEIKTMDWVDHQALLTEDELNVAPGVPMRFATPLSVSYSPEKDGTWETLEDGSWLWRLRVTSPGAESLSFSFSDFRMPAGGQLLLYPMGGGPVLGPYTQDDNKAHGELWTPLILSDDAVIEVRVPAVSRKVLSLRLNQVNHGYRSFVATGPDKAGSCNVDVVCPEGNAWEDEIQSVARLVIGGAFLCTGFMVNNTNEDLTPYFMTANHCGVGLPGRPASSVVFYWHYENPTCRQVGSVENQIPPPTDVNMTTTGSTLLANSAVSDYTLLLLDRRPPLVFDVTWAGWDARNVNPNGAVAIHHPQGHAKRISFENAPTTTTTYLGNDVPGDGTHVRVEDWDVGTTEGGSSGSPLFSPDGHVIGQLHGGFAACGNDLSDWYGRMAVSFPDLAPWLDPDGSGAQTLDGLRLNIGELCEEFVQPGPCIPDDNTFCLLDGRFQVQVEFSTFDDPDPALASTVDDVTANDSGLFYFFNPDNWEFLVKMVDGCGFNNRFWVFAAATTNLEYTLRVTDTVDGCVQTYFNPLGQAAPAITDNSAFATCP